MMLCFWHMSCRTSNSLGSWIVPHCMFIWYCAREDHEAQMNMQWDTIHEPSELERSTT